VAHVLELVGAVALVELLLVAQELAEVLGLEALELE